MQFNSYIFLLAFLPIAITGYWLLKRFSTPLIAKCFLLIANFVFYIYSNPLLAIFLAVSILINFYIGIYAGKHKKTSAGKRLLIVGLIFNIGALGYCKYSNFFIDAMNWMFEADMSYITLIVPLGISFITFQQTAWLVDSYKGKAPQYKLLDYSVFVSFFPTVVSGPIARHDEIIPQLNDSRLSKFDQSDFAKGLYSLCLGLGKKMFIAEAFARIADWGYAADLTAIGSLDALIVIIAYTLQLYFDFSAYCNMAYGVAKMLRIDLPLNFNSPYRALDVDDFWKRWHITLTRFFTRYVYIPLGGNRKGTFRTYVNIFIVFLVSGLWHGANITFIIWGVMHGIGSILSRVFKTKLSKVPDALRWCCTFLFVSIAWVFFRSESLAQAFALIKALANPQLSILQPSITSSFAIPLLSTLTAVSPLELPSMFYASLIPLGILICLAATPVEELVERFRGSVWQTLVSIVILFLCILSFGTVSQFLYMNF